MTTLFFDSETYSEVPIKNGTFAYAQAAETMLVPYAIDEAPAVVWDMTEQALMPLDLKAALADPEVEIVIHNSMFDRSVFRNSPGVEMPVHRVHDTMARALAHSLPGALGKLCEVLNVPVDQAKDKRGHNLIQLFCKPRGKNQKLRRATRLTHPKEWAEFVDYARLDVEAMRQVYKRLPNWNYKGFEYELWKTDQIINERGIAVDVDFVCAAITTVENTQAKLSERTNEATDGAVQKTTQRDKLLGYIKQTYNVDFPDLTGTMVEKALQDENLPASLKELLGMRAEASTSSTAKYRRFLNATSFDGRLRGMFQFCGASRTGRASGRIVQLHNLPRPTMKGEDIEVGIEAMKVGSADLVCENVMALSSNAIRGCLIAPEDKKLLIADLSNIEGRVCAWLASEKWKLKAFEDFDAGIGADLYNLAYARAFHMETDKVTKTQRQVGKVMELMLQYAGGVGAFCTGALAYNIDLDDLAERAFLSIPKNIVGEAKLAWVWAVEQNRTYDLKQETYIVCDSLKRLWRQAHPGIVSLWAGVENMVVNALNNKENIYTYGLLKARRDGAWLRIILPSGRALCYPSMRLEDNKLSYTGVNPYSRQWGRVKTYAGKLVENIVQATARDVLMYGLMNAERVGYKVVAHVHDELICEVPDEEKYTVDRLCDFMTKGIDWTKGMPLAAAGFETKRYRKE